MAVEAQFIGALQEESAKRADEFLTKAMDAVAPKLAADWSLAAKNAIDVALRCEQLLKTRGAAR